MKSVMEEGSSVGNALQKAWDRAGRPVEFSVKVFELPEKNFLGITKKPAKIAIIFDETQKPTEQPKRKKEPVQPRPVQRQAPVKKEPVELRPQQPLREKREHKFVRPSWTDDMVKSAQIWLDESLSFIDYTQPFTTSVDRNYLRVQFDSPVIRDENRQRTLFRSFAHLIMESLRTQFKKDFRNLKVVLFVDQP